MVGHPFFGSRSVANRSMGCGTETTKDATVCMHTAADSSSEQRADVDLIQTVSIVAPAAYFAGASTRIHDDPELGVLYYIKADAALNSKATTNQYYFPNTADATASDRLMVRNQVILVTETYSGRLTTRLLYPIDYARTMTAYMIRTELMMP